MYCNSLGSGKQEGGLAGEQTRGIKIGNVGSEETVNNSYSMPVI